MAFGMALFASSLLDNEIAYAEEINEWIYWLKRISTNSLVVGISICIGLYVKNFKLALAIGLLSLFILLVAFIASPQYLFMAIFFTASFIVVIGVIAIVNTLKSICQWILVVE